MRTRALAVAAGTALTLALAPLTPTAQVASPEKGAPAPKTPPRVQKSAPFGPQPGVQGARNPTDLKTVLYYAADALGMLRGAREDDLILTMQIWATGTMNVGGQPCKLANYLAALRYATPGRQKVPVPAMRVDFACAGANGRPGPRQIQVVADKYAWNETKPGIGGTPAPGTLEDRLLDLWTLFPESVIKAARAAGAETKLTFEGASPILTYPLPAPLAGATMKTTLNPKIFRVDTNPAGVKREFSHLIDRTETRIGQRVVEVTYSNYGDWNDEDLKSMVLLPRHIVAKQGGVTTVDLAITKTDTYNPYVIMPLPQNIEKAAGQ